MRSCKRLASRAPCWGRAVTARRVLFVNNYDSFSYNVVHLLASRNAAPDVVLNDDPRLTAICSKATTRWSSGPGPGGRSTRRR